MVLPPPEGLTRTGPKPTTRQSGEKTPDTSPAAGEGHEPYRELILRLVSPSGKARTRVHGQKEMPAATPAAGKVMLWVDDEHASEPKRRMSPMCARSFTEAWAGWDAAALAVPVSFHENGNEKADHRDGNTGPDQTQQCDGSPNIQDAFPFFWKSIGEFCQICVMATPTIVGFTRDVLNSVKAGPTVWRGTEGPSGVTGSANGSIERPR